MDHLAQMVNEVNKEVQGVMALQARQVLEELMVHQETVELQVKEVKLDKLVQQANQVEMVNKAPG